MKKLLLTAITLFLTAAAHGQITGPKELMCTEEAFTFRANIRSGWHLSTPQMGYPEMIKGAPGFMQPGFNSNFNDMTAPNTQLPLAFERAFNMNQARSAQSSSLLAVMTMGDNATEDRLNYIYHNNGRLLQVAGNKSLAITIH